jgi:hypothetical protein
MSESERQGGLRVTNAAYDLISSPRELGLATIAMLGTRSPSPAWDGRPGRRGRSLSGCAIEGGAIGFPAAPVTVVAVAVAVATI